MPPHQAGWLRRARARALVAAALAVAVAGCGGSAVPAASFDPSSACTTDGRQPGAYPDLEALLPDSYAGRAPDSVDSGRNCTPAALGALAEAGITAVRFAGATWALGGSSGLTYAVFEGERLDPAAMLAFYEAGARGDRKTEKLATSDVVVAGEPGRRLDVLASDGAGHTIVAWPADVPGRVDVLLASDLGDANVASALEELAGR